MEWTPHDDREALLRSPSCPISYESFSRPPAPKRAPSIATSSFTDAQSHVSSETTISSPGSTSGPKNEIWLTNMTAQARYWLSQLGRRARGSRRRRKGGILRLRHPSSAPGHLVLGSVVFLIGFAAAIVAFVGDMGESHLFDWKFGLCTTDWTTTKTLCCSGYNDCPKWRTWSEISHVSDDVFSVLNFAIYTISGLLLALMSHVLTVLAPARPSFHKYEDENENDRPEDTDRSVSAAPAAGSGVSLVKQAVLAGSVSFARDSTPWTARTLVLKTSGLVLSTASGLSVGKEGPYVHLSAAAANLVSSWPWMRARARLPTRKVLCIGAAAGMAAAFGAPVAGLVFVLEEFGQNLTAGLVVPLLGGGVVAVVTLAGLGPYGIGRAVPWEVRYPPRATYWWPFEESAVSLVVGIAAGILGALFIKAVRLWSQQRRRLPLVSQHPAIDVSLVAIITACITFWHKDLRCGTAELLSRLAESTATEGAVAAPRDLVPLGISLLMRLCLTVITFGLEVPQGIYMPSMAMGAILGRFIGHAGLVMAGPAAVATHPAIYAMAGAGAMMTATTRLRLTIIALVFETTRSWEYILPMVVSICTAKAVAARLETQSIYQLAATLHNTRPLDTLLSFSSVQVKDVWEPRSTESTAPSLLHLGRSFCPEPVYGLRRLLRASLARGASHVPVLKEGQMLVGCVAVQSMLEALKSLSDSASITLYHVPVSDTLRMSAVAADHAENIDDDGGEMMRAGALIPPHVDLALQQPAVFASCSTLSSIYAYLSRSDSDFVCVTEHGVFWAVVTRQVLAAWALKGL